MDVSIQTPSVKTVPKKQRLLANSSKVHTANTVVFPRMVDLIVNARRTFSYIQSCLNKEVLIKSVYISQFYS